MHFTQVEAVVLCVRYCAHARRPRSSSFYCITMVAKKPSYRDQTSDFVQTKAHILMSLPIRMVWHEKSKHETNLKTGPHSARSPYSGAHHFDICEDFECSSRDGTLRCLEMSFQSPCTYVLSNCDMSLRGPPTLSFPPLFQGVALDSDFD